MGGAKQSNHAGTIVVLVLVGFAVLIAAGRWFTGPKPVRHPTTVPTTR